MAENTSEKLHSLINILGQLDSGAKVTAAQLAKSLGLAERTIYRYMMTLQNAGYPIYFDRCKMSYRFADGFTLKQHDGNPKVFQALELNSRVLCSSPVGLLSYTADGACVIANEAAATIVGGTRQQMLEQNFYSIDSWKHSGMLIVAQEVLRSGREASDEFHMISSFGKEVCLFCTFSCFDQGEQKYLMLVIQDFTERARTQKQLHILAEQFRILTQTTTDAFWVVGLHGEILEVNDIACSQYGYSRSELVGGMTLRDFEVDESGEEVKQHVSSVFELGYDRFETRHRRKDGAIIDVEVSTALVPETNRLIAFVRDISEKKSA